MLWLKSVLRADPDSQELLVSTSRKLIYTTLAIYLAWHFIATLTWPRAFSPDLWMTTAIILSVSVISLKLVSRTYSLAQIIWLGGLTGAILHAYAYYQRPEIAILLVFLPLMAIVTIGHLSTFIINGLILVVFYFLLRTGLIPPLPVSYVITIILGSIFTALFGWGLSSNLLDALAASSYHYKQARKLLEETRQHRAEISRMLKDQHQANYQLERLNQMLHQARKRAEEARDDRDRFILAVSHELRSPLNFILGFSDLMVNSPETYAEKQEWPLGLYDDVQEIYRSSNHLLGLINDILAMGQIDTQHMTIFRERWKMEDIVNDVVGMTKTAFSQKDLWLHTDFEPGLPEVFVDSTRLRQVLFNLMNNSLRFTERGGVSISLRRDDDWLLVKVEDTGSGIAPEDIPKVFDEFRQVGQENWRRREGVGLGLSISKRFIQLHGGKMWLESSLEEGSSFYFTIPINEILPDDEIALKPDDQQSLRRWVLDHQVRQEQLVLLFSSTPSADAILRQSLDRYQVVRVRDSESIIPHIQQFYPRALIVDRRDLPQVRPLLKSFPYELPVISLELPSGQEQDLPLPDKVVRYLVKPVTRQALLETVQGLGPHVASILVIDDDPAMLRFVTQALKSNPAENGGADLYFSTAATGAQALEQLHAHAFDAILLDLDLPDMSGWDILAQVQQGAARSSPPVVIVSAADYQHMHYAHGQELMDLWMNRPLSQVEFSSILRNLLEDLQPVYPKLAGSIVQAPQEDPSA